MNLIGPHLFECPKCGLISTDYPLKPEVYGKEYLEKYEKYAQTDLGKKIEGFRWGFVRRYLNGHRNLVDYGCGTGAFINSVHAIPGVETFGYEINPFSKYNRPLNSYITPSGTDILTMFDVIEHMESPREFIEGNVRARLLIILTPNVAAVPKSMITQWRHFRPDEHLHYYSIDSLRALFQATGYKLEGWDFCEGAHRNPARPMDLITVAATRYSLVPFVDR